MTRQIREIAADPAQYDTGEVIWSNEGSKSNHVRRIFLERLQPYLEGINGKHVLDVGCGQGWLCAEMSSRGAITLGIDPSGKNIKAAQEQHPDLHFQQSSLQDVNTEQLFDMVSAVMVMEHMPDATTALVRVRSLLNPDGALLLITGDFDKFTRPRFQYTVDTEEIAPGEIATRTDYGERAGVIYDINRTKEVYIEAARKAGLILENQEGIPAPQWLIEEQPKYAEYLGQPLFQLYKFSVADS